jgi:hypothetical protein
MIMTVLSALAAIPQILGYVEAFAAQVTLWMVQRQTNETLSLIADAAAQAARATTDAERYASAQAWQAALTRSRTTAS